MTAADTQATFAATLVDEWVRAGVTDAVIAPGSRSTPIVLAIAGDRRLRSHVVLDERSAGFIALGLALGSGRPAIVVTTSGTAAVELHPAVVEAHHAGIPLVAVTADRPAELQGVGAPQTIDQVGLFGPAVRWHASPGVADRAASASWRSLASRTVAEAAGGAAGPGPVHLNLAFREPLLGAVTGIPPGRSAGAWHTTKTARVPPPDDVVEQLASAGKRGLILAGAGAGAPAAVLDLAAALGWPVLADPRSGCRVPDPLVVAAGDALLRAQPVAWWRPDVVLRLGQPWASRVIATWLTGLDRGVLQIVVDPWGRWHDPERSAGLVVRGDPTALCQAVSACVGRDGGGPAGWAAAGQADRGPPASDWAAAWARVEAAAQDAIDGVLAGHDEVTEPGLARSLGAGLADGATLFASSSMPVRDVEWYLRPRHGLRVLANRGANGIDGVVSTSLGVALGGSCPTVALVGDVAFLYDAGALLSARQSDGPGLTVVVVDNDGGGIFSFLPQGAALSHDRFERFWGTPHGADLAAIAAGYGVPVAVLESAGGLVGALRSIEEATAPQGGVGVVLAKTDRAANVAVHDELHAAVAAAVGRLSW